MMKKIGKAIEIIICTVSIAFLLWGFVSWVDIIADNTQPNPQHSEYNMFVMMVENFEKN